MGGTAIGTPYGYCAAPGLEIYSPGDCLMLSFSVDGNNQPSTQFATASAIQVAQEVPQKTLENAYDSVRIGNDTLKISNVSLVSVPYFDGKVFLGINCKDSKPDFRLVYNPQEPDSAGVKNLYLLAQPSTPNTTDVASIYAFDAMYLIQNAGIVDTTGTVAGYKCKYIKANLKYFTGMSSTGVPVYTMANTLANPYLITIFQ
jgi:hypothetical protein